MDPLGTLIQWVAEYGVFGLIALGIAERFVPILPSYGVLVAIGIATSNGAWTVLAAVAGTGIGSAIGCLVLFRCARVLSEEKTYRLLIRVGRLLGLSPKRVDGTMAAFRAHQHALAFGTQLVPTLRLISPVIAGLFRADTKAFTLATTSGIALWNGLFIGVGHIAGGILPAANASALAFKILMLMLGCEVIVGLLWRYFRAPASA